MSIIWPDYNNSILNLTASLQRKFQLTACHPGLDQLDYYLSADYKNIVFLTLDGLGSQILQKSLKKDSFLRSSYQGDLSSVFPCTTTAATTTLNSGLSPAEHGWIGWNAWFKEYGSVVDLFLDRDSLSGAEIKPGPAATLMPFRNFFDQLKYKSDSSVECVSVMPPFAADGVDSFAEMAAVIRSSCLRPKKKLILAYWYQPDTLMHRVGPDGVEVISELQMIDHELRQNCSDLSDTLIIITADHGQIKVNREHYLDDYPDIMEDLLIPPFLEVRATSFFVKNARRRSFEKRFVDHFGDSFYLMPREEVFGRQLFGPGKPHRKLDDFIGDYLAVAIGHDLLRYNGAFSHRERYYFRGHHAGLCTEEMIVPLIIRAG